jgi:hypothetical protein
MLKESIGTLSGWSYKFLKDIKNINCYLVEHDDIKIIILHCYRNILLF